MENNAMPWWATLFLALLGVGGTTGLLIWIALPTKETIADLRNEMDKQRARIDGLSAKVEELQRDNSLKGRFNTALQMHADELRRTLLKHTPNERIDTAREVMARVKDAFEAEEAENDETQRRQPPAAEIQPAPEQPTPTPAQ